MNRLLIIILLFTIAGCTSKEKSAERWCDVPLRPELGVYKEIATRQPWFKVLEVGEGVFAIVEPYNYQEVISYLIMGTKRNILFDSGMGMARISDVVKELSPLPVTVINSHTHYDHIGGNQEFDSIYAVDTAYTNQHASTGWSHDQVRQEVKPEAFCKDKLPSLDTAAYQILPYKDRIGRFIKDGDTLQLGNRIMEVLQVPGHTPDCVALLDRHSGYLWTGDMFYEAHIWLFMDGTDLDAYQRSIDRFAGLAPSLNRVFPAHNKPAAEPSHLTELRQAFDSVRSGKKSGKPVMESGHPEDKKALEFDFRDFSFLIRKDLLNVPQ